MGGSEPDGGMREVRLPLPARLPGGPFPWLVGAGVGALVLVTVATASGPVTVLSEPQPGRATAPPTLYRPTSTTSTATPATSGPFSDLSSLPSLPPVVVAIIQLVIGALLVWVLYLLTRYAWRNVPRMRTRTVPRRILRALPALPEELVESAARRAALLREGAPRNAIVACWVDLEEAASAAGLPRRAYETSAEYTVRVLRTWDVAPAAMGGLAELYREARYSRHSLTEQHREEAIARLALVHDDLRRIAEEEAARQVLEEAAQAVQSGREP